MSFVLPKKKFKKKILLTEGLQLFLKLKAEYSVQTNPLKCKV